MNQSDKDNPILLLQKMHRWRMAFFGLAILLAGVVIGTASTLIFARNTMTSPPPGPQVWGEMVFRAMDRNLGLSPEQDRRIRPLVEQRMETMQDLVGEVRPKIAEQFRLMNEEVVPLLTERQRPRWERDFGRVQGHFRRGPRGGRGPGAGQGAGPPGPGGGFRGGRERFDDNRPPAMPRGAWRAPPQSDPNLNGVVTPELPR